MMEEIADNTIKPVVFKTPTGFVQKLTRFN